VIRETKSLEYRQVLSDAARYLALGSDGPLDVFRLCCTLSVSVQFGDLPGKARAVVVQRGEITEIRLRKNYEAPEMIGWARFLVAHELGHILLSRECRASPMGDSEYWVHEKLCDDFARALLVPDQLVASTLENLPTTTIGMVARINRLATVASVPWLTAAIRFCASVPEIAAFCAKIEKANDGSVRRYRVVSSTLPDNQERNRLIPVDSMLGNAFQHLSEQRRIRVLDVACFADGTIPSCKTANSGVVDSQGDGKYRLLVRLARSASSTNRATTA
jgi:hypothetical protein